MASIINGLFAGRAGITSHGLAIATVGDNIANGNTIGYKAARTEFEDVMAGGQTPGRVVGSGSSASRITSIMEQGTFEFTGRPLDLGIDGDSFFVIQDGDTGQRYYTRAGNFRVNDEGQIVTQRDEILLGYSPDGSGTLQEINVNTFSQPNVDTNLVDVGGNLDSTSAIVASPEAAAPGNNSSATYQELSTDAQFQTSVTVFDPLGAKHDIRLFYYHTGVNQWEVGAYVDQPDVSAAGTAGEPFYLGSFNLAFNSDGSRATPPPALGTGDFNFAFNWANGSTPPAHDVELNLDPYTQFATSSSVDSIVADGSGVGAISNISVSKDGVVFAVLDNGTSTELGTVALVRFANPEGLQRLGQNRLLESIDSGTPVLGTPGGNFGSIEGGNLELSTTDIANEFVKLITLQRGFQASSRIIGQIDNLLNEIIQLA